MREWAYSSTILNFGTSWRRVVSITPLSLYPQGNGPRDRLHRRLCVPQSRSGHYGEDKNLLPSPGNEPRLTTLPCSTVRFFIFRLLLQLTMLCGLFDCQSLHLVMRAVCCLVKPSVC
jgi:hypothetical protein